jgi:hypothetical protein
MPESVKKRFLDHLAISNKTIDEASQDDFEAFKTIEIEQFKEQSIFNSEKHIVAAEAQKEIEEIVKIKSFQDPMPQVFKNRFQDHLALSDKSLKEASQEDFEDFKKQEIEKARDRAILNEDKYLVPDAGQKKFDDLMKIKSLRDPMPQEIKNRFQDHLALSDKSMKEASQEDFEDFKKQEIEKTRDRAILNEDKYLVPDAVQKKVDDLMKIKSLRDPMPQEIKKRFLDHLSTSNKSAQEASEKDFEDFKKQEIEKAREQSILVQDKILVTDHLKADQGVPASATAPGRDQKLMALLAENEALKSKMKTLASEVKILKDSRTQMAEIHKKALEATTIATHGQSDNKADLLLKEQMLQKLKEQKVFGDQETRKYVELMDREKQTLRESKELENKLKKLQIESTQKENFFTQEVEKSQRQLKAKDLVVLKTKESLMKIVEKKDEELKFMQEKLNQTMRALENANPQAQAIYVKDLERKVSNSEKMIEIYKEKISQKPSIQTGDESLKDENRKLAILNNQMKNQLDVAKREVLKLQERVSQDSALVMGLKADKTKLELAAKKASLEVKKEELTSNNQPALENEIKKLKNLCDFYEGQIKEAQARQRDTDAKYQASLKLQKKEVIAEDSGKGKVGQLENNLRKLTQDLMESKNQMTEMKKESTKLKQEKIALQNQLDNLKKSTDKSKGAAPKKPGSGGKAA